MGLLEAIPEDDGPGRRRSRRRGRRRHLGPSEPGLGPARRRARARPLRLEGQRRPPSSSRPPAPSSATSASPRRCTRTRTAPAAGGVRGGASSGGSPEVTDERLGRRRRSTAARWPCPALRGVDDADVRPAPSCSRRSAARRATPRPGDRGRRTWPPCRPDDPPVHRPPAARHGARARRRAPRLRGHGAGVAHAAAVGHRPRRRGQRPAVPAPRRAGAAFEEAILWHGGEAETAAEAFRTASAEERGALVAFLEAL